jgi:hypothetical protein
VPMLCGVQRGMEKALPKERSKVVGREAKEK